MSSVKYDSEQELFRDNLKRYINYEIVPHYEQWEKNEIHPRDVWNKLGEQGFLCVDLPESEGGFGVNFRYSMIIIEELNKANLGALATNVTVHSDIVTHYISNNGTAEQKETYLPAMVSGDIVGAIAMTEPGCGSDLQGIRTTAKADGENFILNGSKTFITNGQYCDIVIVAARTNTEVIGAKGTSLFIVDCKLPGFTRGRNLEKIGLHAGDTSELFFQDVVVPKSSLLGPLDGGFNVLMQELARERLALACGAVASAEGNIEATIDYLNERKAFGKSLSALQTIRHKMAEVATETRVHRSFIEECKTLFEAQQLDIQTVSMAKLSATEMQGRVADACLQLHGGYGYMTEYGVSRAFVDARVQRIYGGTSEIMKEIIGRHLF